MRLALSRLSIQSIISRRILVANQLSLRSTMIRSPTRRASLRQRIISLQRQRIATPLESRTDADSSPSVHRRMLHNSPMRRQPSSPRSSRRRPSSRSSPNTYHTRPLPTARKQRPHRRRHSSRSIRSRPRDQRSRNAPIQLRLRFSIFTLTRRVHQVTRNKVLTHQS